MKIISIVGACPQFIKLMPLIRVIAVCKQAGSIEHFIVHTGQHYDAALSDIFFMKLALPQPDYNLEAGSGLHGYQTGLMLQKVEQVLLEFIYYPKIRNQDKYRLREFQRYLGVVLLR